MRLALGYIALGVVLVAGFADFPEPSARSDIEGKGAQCPGYGQDLVDCAIPEQNRPTCTEPDKHLKGRRSRSCTEDCVCPYWLVETNDAAWSTSDNTAFIWDPASSSCITYAQCLPEEPPLSACGFTQLVEGSWCNSDLTRKQNKNICETSMMLDTDGAFVPCRHKASKNKCQPDYSRSGSGGDDCMKCLNLNKMTNLRSLDKPKWCSSRNEADECEKAYVSDNGDNVHFCQHDGQRCSAGDPVVCETFAPSI